MSFGALTGGGGASLDAISGAEAGDVSSGIDFSLATNNSFSVGGSGKQEIRSDSSGATGNPNANANIAALPPSQQPKINLPLIVAVGALGLVGVASVLRKK